MPTEKMLAERDGAIGTIVFNNPERHNAVSLEMWEAMDEILADFAADPAIRVVVLRGAGEKAFVAGADISRFESERASEEAVRKYNETTDRATTALAALGKPTIAMIRGWCIGGGLGIAVSCDLRFASEESKFGVPAARLGLGYGFKGVKRLVDLVGPAFAREIFYTARHFTAAEAAGMGLVNRIVPSAALVDTVRETAVAIAGNAPLTIHAVKRTVEEVLKEESRRDLALCDRLVAECFASEDYKEGRRAFMEKRPPVFKGR